jgi:hypothetical protein
MYDEKLHIVALPKTNKPLRIAARQAHWLQVAFKQYLDIVGQDIGCAFTLDTAKLSACFVRWLRAIGAQNPRDRSLRREYFGFSAGLMLRELVQGMPVAAVGKPQNIPDDAPAAYWPEGVACAMFCLAVLHAVEAEEFKAKAQTKTDMRDLRFWWSFKENAAANADYAVAFFDTLIGVEPDWFLPATFHGRNLLDIGAQN